LLDAIVDPLASVFIAFSAKRVYTAEKRAAYAAGDAVVIGCFIQ
jgi:hypothetical protein